MTASIIDLPAWRRREPTTLTGSLIFGIDTQTNNASGSETILGVDLSYGDFTDRLQCPDADPEFSGFGNERDFLRRC